MADRPIIFSGAMVRAILDGRKSMTRRVLKPQPNMLNGGRPLNDGRGSYSTETGWKRLPYAPGDRLYVREHWRTARAYDDLAPSAMAGEEPVKYEADGTEEMWGWPGLFLPGRFRHGRHMPRWASRITLTVTEVRVQRLQEISREDAIAEGIEGDTDGWFDYLLPATQCCARPQDSYATLWNSLHGPDAWDANPWVVAVSFTTRKGNIDAA